MPRPASADIRCSTVETRRAVASRARRQSRVSPTRVGLRADRRPGAARSMRRNTMPVSAGAGRSVDLDLRAGVQADAGRADRVLERALLQHGARIGLAHCGRSAQQRVRAVDTVIVRREASSARALSRPTRRRGRRFAGSVGAPAPSSVGLLAQERRDVDVVDAGSRIASIVVLRFVARTPRAGRASRSRSSRSARRVVGAGPLTTTSMRLLAARAPSRAAEAGRDHRHAQAVVHRLVDHRADDRPSRRRR